MEQDLLRRAIQTKIEDPLANEVLEGRIHQGDLISVQMKNKQVRFYSEKRYNISLKRLVKKEDLLYNQSIAGEVFLSPAGSTKES